MATGAGWDDISTPDVGGGGAALPPDAGAAALPSATPDIQTHVNALIQHESGGVSTAVGDKGLAVGLGQMHPEVRRAYGVKPNSTPEEQRAAVTSYFTDLWNKHKGNVDDALSEYHLGAHRYARERNSPANTDYLAQHKAILQGASAPTQVEAPSETTASGWDAISTAEAPETTSPPPAEPPGTTVSKPTWYSGLADEAGEHFAAAVHNASESAKSLAQAPEGVRQVVGDLLGMMEPWMVTGQMSGEAASRGTAAAGGGERLQRVARVLGTIAGSMATPAPPGVGLAARGVSKAVGAVAGRGATAGEEAVSAARAAAPEAAGAAETIAGAAPASAEAAAAPAAAGKILAPSGATTEQIGTDVKSALGARQTALKDQAGSIYDNAVANADAAGAALDTAEYPALQAHLKAVRTKLGTLPPQAESAVANLETKAASGAPISASDLNGYKAAVDQTFPGKMKSGPEVRDWLRSLFSAEDKEWAQTADKLWRDELVGRGMTETSLGSLTKLIKKSDPGAVVEKLFGTGSNDRQAALAKSVLRHLEVESPGIAQSLRDAVFNRAITKASAGANFGTSLLEEFDSFNPAFRSSISNPGADAFFTVLRQEAGKGAAGPSRAAMMTARGLKIAGAGAAEAVGRHFGVPFGSVPAAGMELMIPTADLAKFLTNSQTAKLLARALKTPMNSAVVPTIIKSLRDSHLGQELLSTSAGQQKQSEAQQTMETANAAQ